MSDDNQIIVTPRAAPLAEAGSVDLWDDALTHVIAENSRRTYRLGMGDFARFLLGILNPDEPLPSDHREAFQKAIPYIGTVDFRLVTRYREHLRSRGLAPTTINNRLAAINTLFVRMMRLGHIKENPADPTLVARMRVSNVSSTEGLSEEEGRHLLDTCRADQSLAGLRDTALILVLIYNGLRRAEVIQLDIDRVRFINDIPTYAITGKGDKVRVIELVPDVWTPLTRWTEEACIKQGPVFRRVARNARPGKIPSKKRLTEGGVYHIIKRRIKQAGITKTISPHSMRHTFATLTLLAGAPLQEVQIALGHSSPSTTMRYNRALNQIGRSPSRKITLGRKDKEDP